MFDCILHVYEHERNGWLCTYHIWLILVCRTRLIVYLSDMIMRKFLIVYLPYMSLEDMVDCELTIYEWYEFVGHGCFYSYCIHLLRNVWLYTSRIWAWKIWLTVHLPYMINMSLWVRADCIRIVYDYGEIFYCILTVYVLGRHGWGCTYHMWVIWDR